MSDFTTHYITARRAEKARTLSSDAVRGLLFGVEGPDFLFYASIFSKSAETDFGFGFHKYVPKEFFQRCVEDLRNTNQENYELKKGYISGLLLHYMGDMSIHPYINWLEENRNPTGFKYIHMLNEAEIDLHLYEMEYGKKISTLDPTKEFIYDGKLEQVIYEVWKHQDMQPLSKKVIKRGFSRLVFLSKLFGKNWFSSLAGWLEPKSAKGYFSCHFKNHENLEVMNLEGGEWDCNGEKSTLSVPKIIDETMRRYYAEVEKIGECLASGKEYSFDHTVNFDGKICKDMA